MCGIAGLWMRSGSDLQPQVRAMTAALHHRGPDSSDIWASLERGLALGHARLSIVDLSEHGRQPMHSQSGRYVIVYNGEIYNHLEIRAQLGLTVSWRGHSDTETLLAAIEAWGLEHALRELVGMFAIALWDRHEATLTLARDRMGEKPLYIGAIGGGLAFASEIKALRHCQGMRFEHDQTALSSFLRVGYIGGTRSAYRGIRKLAPGTYLRYRNADALPEAVQYWTLPEPATSDSHKLDDVEMVDEFEGLLDRSVRGQMLADVPLGAFLSGGIDSSLIVALMQRASQRPVRTFTMGFSGQTYDESASARHVARYLGTDHTELMVEPSDVLKLIPRIASIYDEPFADSSQVPTVLLSQLIRQHVTVALSGDAGDELFGGYNRYMAAQRLGGILSRVPLGLRRWMAVAMRGLPADFWDQLARNGPSRGRLRLPPEFGEKVARLASFLEAPDGRAAYASAVSPWPSETAQPFSARYELMDLPVCDRALLPECMMWWDMQTYLPDDILVKVDRAAMSASLETRVPLLDHRIVEFALRTPLRFKIRGGRSKWLMRELLYRHVPQSLIERPKQGFTLPLGAWLRNELREWAESLMEPRVLALSGLLDATKVQKIWREHLDGKVNHQKGLWTLLTLQSWLTNKNDV